jgi:hypothetical protein
MFLSVSMRWSGGSLRHQRAKQARLQNSNA